MELDRIWHRATVRETTAGLFQRRRVDVTDWGEASGGGEEMPTWRAECLPAPNRDDPNLSKLQAKKYEHGPQVLEPSSSARTIYAKGCRYASMGTIIGLVWYTVHHTSRDHYMHALQTWHTPTPVTCTGRPNRFHRPSFDSDRLKWIVTVDDLQRFFSFLVVSPRCCSSYKTILRRARNLAKPQFLFLLPSA